jgi:glycosyltransferase involved in cell wall biosynthesis
MKLNIFGGVSGDSGYAAHTRNLSKALSEKGVDVALEGTSSSLEPWNSMSKKNYQHENSLMIQLPNAWSFKYHDRCEKLIGYGVFEGDKVSDYWAKCANDEHVTEIWYPSFHAFEAFENAGVKKKSFIIPHGVDEKVFNMSVERSREFDSSKFTFLFVGGWADGINDRKGLDILLRAFTKEFKKDESVQLIAKVNMAYCPPEKVIADIDALKLPDKNNRANVILLLQNFSEKNLAQLYRFADVIVAPSKAEAFNMPVLEACACGCYPIATDYGGQLDYLKTMPSSLITSSEIQATGGYWYEQTKWHLPNEESLRVRMREAFCNKGEIKEEGKICSETVLKSWKWSDSAVKALEALK